MKEKFEEVFSYADTLLGFVTEVRQDFHRYAESGWLEVRTCSKIAEHLKRLGYTDIRMGKDVIKADARMGLPDQAQLDMAHERALSQGADPRFAERFRDGFTGIVAVLDTGWPGPTVAFHYCIDALCIAECDDPESHRPAREGFASVNAGEMHACGHDAHAAIGMAVADVLMRFRDKLCGTVKFVFQPAEEGVRGALAIAESGILDDVDYLVGLHLWKHLFADFAFTSFGSMANVKLDVDIVGKASHALYPQEGSNALLAASQIVSGLYGIPRTNLGKTYVNVGRIDGGTARNVVCDHVKLEMELRAETPAASNYLSHYAEQIIEHGAAMHGCSTSTKLMGKTFWADSCITDEFERELKELAADLGFWTVGPGKKRGKGSGDITTLCRRVLEHGGKAGYFQCMAEITAPFHSPEFDLQEKDLMNAVKFEVAIALNEFQERPVTHPEARSE